MWLLITTIPKNKYIDHHVWILPRCSFLLLLHCLPPFSFVLFVISHSSATFTSSHPTNHKVKYTSNICSYSFIYGIKYFYYVCMCSCSVLSIGFSFIYCLVHRVMHNGKHVSIIILFIYMTQLLLLHTQQYIYTTS